MSNVTNEVSRNLRQLADEIDKQIENIAGERVAFTLIVWTPGRFSYISTTPDRREVARGMLSVVDHWRRGGLDIPVHELS